MQRIRRAQSATLSHTFYVDGVATNPSPDTATVTITRDNGTAIVTAVAATEAGTGVVTYTLTPAQTTTLDILTVTWTATFGGQSQSFTDIVEIVGGFLFTIAQARALSPLNNTVTYTTQKIVDARTLVETKLEQACGVAFVPRYTREFVSGRGLSTILLRPRVTAIRSVELDGTAISASDLATLKVRPTGQVYYPAYWYSGWDNYEVVFEHGYSEPPPWATEAALLWAKSDLVKGPVDERTTALSNEDGTFSLSTPGVRGAISGIPAVDEMIRQFKLEHVVA